MPNEGKPLNVRQERFANLVASGVSATEAYVQAGYNVSRNTAGTNGPRLLENAGVAARIAELRGAIEKPMVARTLLTIEEKRQYLADLLRAAPDSIGPDSPLCHEFQRYEVAGGARGTLKRGTAASGNEIEGLPVIRTKVKLADKLRAIELDSKLAGHFKPDEVVVETGPITLTTIKEIADRVRIVSPLLLTRLKTAGRPASGPSS